MKLNAFEHAERVKTILYGYRESRILITFAELGIADVLADGPRMAGEIAAAIAADPIATARFLRAAESLGLVRRVEDRYVNGELIADVLTSAGSASLLQFVRREVAFYRRWTHLTEAIRSGTRPEANRRGEQDPNWVREFTLALYDIARLAAPRIVTDLSPLIASVGRPISVIDVGGGHGGYSLELARRFSDLRAVVIDLPPVITITREIIASSGLGDRVVAKAGNFHTDSLGSGYDIALLFGVLVGEDEERSIALLRTVGNALNPGGYVVVRGRHAAHEDRDLPEAALFDLHMLLSTDHGAVRPTPNVESWMVAAGLELVPPVDLSLAKPERLLVGRVR